MYEVAVPAARTSRRTSAWSAIAAAVIAFSPSSVCAEAIAVLGLRAPAGDDVFAANYSIALRGAAQSVPEWTVPRIDASLDQMLLAHGCPEPSLACLQEIANSLGVARLIFGTVWRTTTLEQARFDVEVVYYDAVARRTLTRVRDTLPLYQFSVEDLAQPSRRIALQFSGRESLGAIRVRSNLGSATVFLDGERVGAIREGKPEVELDASPGPHFVEVFANGYQPFRRRVGVRVENCVLLTARLVQTASRSVGRGIPGEVFPEGGDPGIPNWLPLTLLGVAAASGVLQVVSWLQAERAGDTILPLEDDDIVLDYRRRNPGLGAHPCDAIENGTGPNDSAVSSLCASSRTWAIVTYITFPIFLVSATAGLALFIIDMEDVNLRTPRPERSERSEASMRLNPWLDRNEVGLGATVTF